MSVTVTDIAERLGLSPSTVSRSLRHSSRVHPETRAKVAQMAMELGYHARGKPGKSAEFQSAHRRVAVIPQSVQFRNSTNTVRLLEGIATAAPLADMSINLGIGLDPHHAPAGELPACITNSPPDIALLLGRHHPDTARAIQNRCPIISVEWPYPGVRCDLVCTADTIGMAALTCRILDLGHQRIAWIGEAYAASFRNRRLAGMIQACLDRAIDPAGIPRLETDGFDSDGHLIPDCLRELLDMGITCFMCVSDRVAFEVCGLLNTWDIRVPQDISVTGFDAMQDGQTLRGWSRLTSVDPCFVQIGRSAIELAARRLEQPAAHPISVSPEPSVVEGDTLAAPRDA